ncbi:Maf family nucleotide pyrophosphatase [Aequorivita antarctica]|uniref:dTTP/UTP pyrophosphatase n=1 Tax=Aequorivita antarctica TaxID=153266 RepID=A0A5C6Z2D3_9FLAO|nr:Maf family nucleotide pyrophosphatase [Aequorivita antarctica]TXD73630.1 septum formation protein Maf [Aequorivita antarctica]SRX75073.1 Septum formation protein Maf [Aequorivita antarctica]
MLRKKLIDYNIILASGSPRRQDFFRELNLDFTIQVKEIEETYSIELNHSEITDYLSQLKASVFVDLSENDILITSDTIVWKDEKALGKPKNYDEARKMLQLLSGEMHEVITSVCFTSKGFQKIVHDVTKVWFKPLSEEEIDFYIKNYRPFDKAGGYGIQEWIGYIGIEKIEGCYFNVMGLPTRLVYKTLSQIANR